MKFNVALLGLSMVCSVALSSGSLAGASALSVNQDGLIRLLARHYHGRVVDCRTRGPTHSGRVWAEPGQQSRGWSE